MGLLVSTQDSPPAARPILKSRFESLILREQGKQIGVFGTASGGTPVAAFRIGWLIDRIGELP